MNSGAGGPEARLFRRYWAFASLIAIVPVVTLGLVEMVFAYRENVARTEALQQAQLTVAQTRIGEQLIAIERSVQRSARLPFSPGLLGPADRQLELQRLLNLVPAVSEVAVAAVDGRELFFISRYRPDIATSNRAWQIPPPQSLDTARGVAYGQPYFRDDTDPFVLLYVAGFDVDSAFTIAEIKLKFVRDVISTTAIGHRGTAILMDSRGQLLAHRDWGLVLANVPVNESQLFKALTAARKSATPSDIVSFQSVGLNGDAVVASAVSLGTPAWTLIVEQPREEVFAGVWASAYRLALMLLASLLLAFLVSRWFALRMTRPILAIKAGVDRFGAGQFDRRIDLSSGDELEALARSFNQMAAVIQDYAAGLESKVAEKTRELELANRHKSEFLANMSHELRTPLNAIIGMSSALKDPRYGFGALNAKQLEYIDDINTSGQHLLAMINEILDLAKVEAGRLELEPTEVDVPALLRAALALMRERAERGGVRLVDRIDSDVGLWLADEKRLRQIVINLLSNAVKFTESGGEVALAAAQTESMLTIEVTDSGVGIAPEDQKVIFEEFRQARAPGHSRAEGTGLGLALTRRFVELHGGSISVDSIAGEGSTFTVRLPRLAKETVL